MKRKILSLILVLMLVPFASLFSACGKDDGYNLNALKTNFDNMIDSTKNIKVLDGEVVVDYSLHTELENVILHVAEYSEIEDYNKILNNSMAFAVNYIDVFSNNVIVDEGTKNGIEQNLLELQRRIEELDNSMNSLAEIVNISSAEERKQTVCLERYESLLLAYNKAFIAACKFNSNLAYIYFNNVLRGANSGVYETGVTNFDANSVISTLDARIKQQVVSLTQNYVEMYLNNKEFVKNIAYNKAKVDLSKYGYETKVLGIFQDFKEETAADKANNEANKNKFFEFSVSAQNLQKVLLNNYQKVAVAYDEIDYTAVIADRDNMSLRQSACVNIIEDNRELLGEYNIVLSEMVKIIK